MARRRVKRRTQPKPGSSNAQGSATGNNLSKTPRSMVIRIGAGEVGPSVSQLVKDVRSLMEPDTAGKLKERRTNRLRDYTTMAGPLGVSHLLLFSRSTSGNVNLRLAVTPRGPTFHFRVEKYSLCKDVKKAQKHATGGGKEYLSPPLLVMNNFTSQPSTDGQAPAVPKHLETLTTTVFQSLFPPIIPQATPLSSIRRVLLLNRESSKATSDGSYILNLRHYAIYTKRTGLSRSIRRINAAEKMLKEHKNKRAGLPNLGKLTDVADYILDPSAAGGGFTSGSESEFETDAEVEVMEMVARKVVSKGKKTPDRKSSNPNLEPQGDRTKKKEKDRGPMVEKRAVKLVELGPRMRLRMTKVEEGVCTGKVLWHASVKKSRQEEKALDATWENRRKEKEERRRVQRENVGRKRAETAGKRRGQDKHDGNDAVTGDGEDEEDADEFQDEEWDSEDLDDAIDQEDQMEVDDR
ncbi:hypothetical protein MMC25_003893 [Agyrium rufum]|nr:hypothetical protein [Agyrium rufum]